MTFDGHTSRWSYAGISYLLKNNVWPFCLASHSSAWAQPCDMGVNSFLKALYGHFVHRWRFNHVHCRFTRAAWNACFVATFKEAQSRLAAELQRRPLPARPAAAVSLNLTATPPPVPEASDEAFYDWLDTVEDDIIAAEIAEVERAIHVTAVAAVTAAIGPAISSAAAATADTSNSTPTTPTAAITPTRKIGNIVTRSFDRTGICQRDANGTRLNPHCVGWTRAIATLGNSAAPSPQQLSAEAPVLLRTSQRTASAPQQVFIFRGQFTRCPLLSQFPTIPKLRAPCTVDINDSNFACTTDIFAARHRDLCFGARCIALTPPPPQPTPQVHRRRRTL